MISPVPPAAAAPVLLAPAASASAVPSYDPVRAINPAQSEYIDILRGLAAQLVLAHHAVAYCLPHTRLDQLGGGALGVLIFFLLSGFLIADTIRSRVEANRFCLTEFTVSRFSRIFMPYVPAILLVAVLDRFSIDSRLYEYAADYNWQTAVANLLMLQDFPLFQVLRRLHLPEQPWFFKSFGSGRQFWTVSIEWWIYLTVGLATYLALRRRPAPWWAWLLLAAFAIEPAYNFVGGPGDCLTLAWLIGAGANVVYRRVAAEWAGGPVPGWCVVAWACVAVLAGVRLFFTQGRIYEAVFALLLAGVLFLPLALLLGRRGLTPLHWTGLHRLSFHSYSLYLTHGSVVLLLLVHGGSTVLGWPGFVLVLLVCNAVAVPFAMLFEVPHRRVRQALLRRLPPLRCG